MGTIRAHLSRKIGLSPAVVVPLKKREFEKTTSGKIQRSAMQKALTRGAFDERLRSLKLPAYRAGEF